MPYTYNPFLFWFFLGWFPLFWFWSPLFLLNGRMGEGRGSRALGGTAFVAILVLLFLSVFAYDFDYYWWFFWICFFFIVSIWGIGGAKLYYFRDEANERADMKKMDVKPAGLKSINMQL